MKKILLLQGANMIRLGSRQPEVYGTTTAKELDAMLLDYAASRDIELSIFYTNSESEAIDKLYDAEDGRYDAVVMNPGGFTRAGFALLGCMKGIKIPVIEIHMTNHFAGTTHSACAAGARGVIMGFGIKTYFLGLDAASHILEG
jgi:3-dehydroquinate dehydratase-2